jgi:hypothetical protein
MHSYANFLVINKDVAIRGVQEPVSLAWRMVASGLCGAAAFVRIVKAAHRTVWCHWCERSTS